MENNQVATINKNTFSVIESDFISQSHLSKEDFQREASFAIQHYSNSEQLQKCTKESLIKAVLNVAQTGLTLNPVRKFAWLVPRWNTKKNCLEAVLEPSYVGLCKLITDARSVKSISAQLIWEGDEIDIDIANNQIKHTPYVITGKPRGQMKAAYSLAILKDGSKHLELMSKEDIEEIRERSESYIAFKAKKIKSCIWEKDAGEMWRKTVIKRHYKYMPKSESLDKVEQAIELDNEVNGYEKERVISIQKYLYIESLLRNCTLPEEKYSPIEKEMEGEVSPERADEIITYLLENQKQTLDEQVKAITS